MSIICVCSITALDKDWCIHHDAYVENLNPFVWSNFVTAFMSPMFPSWIKSVRGSPLPVYLFASSITSLRLDLTNFSWNCFDLAVYDLPRAPSLLSSLRGIPFPRFGLLYKRPVIFFALVSQNFIFAARTASSRLLSRVSSLR